MMKVKQEAAVYSRSIFKPMSSYAMSSYICFRHYVVDALFVILIIWGISFNQAML